MTYSDEERMKHQSWCFKNDIRIYYKSIDNVRGKIIIEENGISSVSEETYRNDNKLWRRKKVKGEPKQKIFSERIFELYTIKFLEKNGKNMD